MKKMEGQAADVLNVIFMIDTSGSMSGEKINSINTAMPEIVDELKDFENSPEGRRVEFRFAVISFDSNVRWDVTPPKNLNDFSWQNLKANGMTSLGRACELVEEKLHVNSDFFSDVRTYLEPLIILLSDGEPNDDEWETKIEKLKKNKHFINGTVISIALPDIDKSGEDVLIDFCRKGNEMLYISVSDPKKIVTVLKIASISASKSMSSGGSMANNNVAAINVMADLQNGLAGIDNVDFECVAPTDLQPKDADDF